MLSDIFIMLSKQYNVWKYFKSKEQIFVCLVIIVIMNYSDCNACMYGVDTLI